MKYFSLSLIAITIVIVSFFFVFLVGLDKPVSSESGGGLPENSPIRGSTTAARTPITLRSSIATSDGDSVYGEPVFNIEPLKPPVEPKEIELYEI